MEILQNCGTIDSASICPLSYGDLQWHKPDDGVLGSGSGTESTAAGRCDPIM